MEESTGARIVTAMLGLVVLLPAFVAGVAGLWLASDGLQAPDPFAPDHTFSVTPDSWAEVVGMLAKSLLPWSVAFLLVALSVGLLGFAQSNRWPARRTLALIPPVGLAGTVIVYASIAATLGPGRPGTDCRTFRFDPSAFRSSISERHLTAAFGVGDCGTLRGMTPRQVEAFLGSGHADGDPAADPFVLYDDLPVHFDGGRVVRVDRPRIEPIDDL